MLDDRRTRNRRTNVSSRKKDATRRGDAQQRKKTNIARNKNKGASSPQEDSSSHGKDAPKKTNTQGADAKAARGARAERGARAGRGARAERNGKATRSARAERGTKTTARTANSSRRQTNRKGRRPSARAEARGKEQRMQARKLSHAHRIGVASSAVVLASCAVIGLLFFARPSVSKLENRALYAFPTFTWESFLDGSFFSDVALWYSDTYPIREQLVYADQTISDLHGIKTETQMIGGVRQADELPPVEDNGKTNSAASSNKQDATDDEDRAPVEVPAQEVMAAAIQDQITNGLYVKGDTAYNIYYFLQDSVQEYADAVNATAKALDGQAEVYSLIAPNSSGILLSDQEVKDLGGTNQADAIRYFYSLYDSNVHTIDSVSKLKQHTDEYIYFRTDHHWTARGAYYAYEAFCEKKGIKPESLDSLEHKDFGDFLGSFYGELSSPEMEAHPDTVEAWVPNGTNTMTLYDTDGSAEEYPVITDTSSWDILGKTMAFIMGDQPLEKISNPKVTDGSSCLVIKDSFGDFFVPWLVDHYETVWVADFRYFEGNIVDFVKENNINDVIIESNISLAGGGVFAPAIMGRL